MSQKGEFLPKLLEILVLVTYLPLHSISLTKQQSPSILIANQAFRHDYAHYYGQYCSFFKHIILLSLIPKLHLSMAYKACTHLKAKPLLIALMASLLLVNH